MKSDIIKQILKHLDKSQGMELHKRLMAKKGLEKPEGDPLAEMDMDEPKGIAVKKVEVLGAEPEDTDSEVDEAIAGVSKPEMPGMEEDDDISEDEFKELIAKAFA